MGIFNVFLKNKKPKVDSVEAISRKVFELKNEDVSKTRSKFDIEADIQRQDQIEMQFKAKLYFKNGIIGLGEGAINYNKERFAVITGSKGKIFIPVYNRISEYTIETSLGKIERSFPIIGDDMTMEIQALIDDVKNKKHENSLHSLDDSMYLQQIIEKIREVGTK